LGQTTPERARLAGFLLRRLAAAESEAISDELFRDEQLLRELEDVERDLLDAYAAGSLSDADRHDVDVHLMTSDSQREKLRFAFALGQTSRQHRFSRMGLAAAAVVLIAAAGGAFRIARLSSQNQRLQTEMAELRARNAHDENAAAVAYLLSPIDRGSAAETLDIAAGVTLIHLNLAVESSTGNTAEVRLETAAGQILLEQRGVPLETIQGTRYLSVWLPSGALPDGSYTVSAVDETGRNWNFAFRTIRRK
jgi:hypothetical protein